MSEVDPVDASTDAIEVKLNFPVDLPTPYGRFQTVLIFPESEIRLSDLAREIFRHWERIMDMMLAAKGIPAQTISCAKGCGACCRQAVPISPPEALVLAECFESFPPDRQKILARRFASAQDRFVASGLKDVAVGLMEKNFQVPASDSLPEGTAFARAYFKQGMACPFLEDEACSIHSHRPIACRNYLVTSPAALCSKADSENSGIKALQASQSISRALSMLTAEIQQAAPEVGLVITALDWSHAHPDLGNRKFDTIQLVGRFLELMKPRNSQSEIKF